MSNEQIVETPKQDLHAAVANAPKNAELILAPGKYVLNRPLVVDKTIVMRSQTGKADDVTIGRNNATVLVVTDGAPTFHGILFFAPATSDDAPVNTNEHDFIEYESAVAVRDKGNATFIGCKGASKQKSAFSARGKKARITLEKCWIPYAAAGGLFVDGLGEGVVKESLIQNCGWACVDVEEEGSKLSVFNSRLERGGYGAIVAHNKGSVYVENCKVDVGVTFGAVACGKSQLEAKGTSFYTEVPNDNPIVVDKRYGVLISDGTAKLVDCFMTKLVLGVFMSNPEGKIELQRVKTQPGLLTPLVYISENPSSVKISDCSFGEPPLDMQTFMSALYRMGYRPAE